MKKILTALIILTGIAGFSVLHAAELWGIVTDSNGKPVSGKQVTLKNANDPRNLQSTRSGPDGKYSFKNINLMSYIVSVNGSEYTIFVGPGESRRDFRLK